ncbi:MFS transporter [Rhizobiaceae bacterium n13]|uniref:MFS transporter n=1 Tax=Ferirhizobium litorale TaxID=2927786 RepID=UPI0024B30C07|nr:MFS transporter [Fererhizobium litorale]MDI7864961.1 MFS transporter [Fererhizobium litorale]
MSEGTQRPHVLLFLIAGTGVVTIARAMTLTFLAIKLQGTFGLGPAMIGFLLGIGPLIGAFASPFAGSISDRVGRKSVLILTLVAMGLSMVGLALAETVFVFCLAQSVAAVALSIYGPTSRALMSDICPESDRLKFFSWRYTVSNVGWAIGPVIGIAAGVASTILFVTAGAVYGVLALSLYWLQTPAFEDADDGAASSATSLSASVKAAMRDPRLLYFIGGGTMLVAVYGQWSATVGPYLADNVEGGVELFAYLASINGLVVLIVNPIARRFVERVGALSAVVTGCALFLLSQLGFLAAVNFPGFAISMVVFTLGEILVLPSEYILVDRVSNARNRGSYFGAHSLSSIGSFLGPTLGGMVLGVFGGAAMFVLFAGFAAAGALFFAIGTRMPPPMSETGSSVDAVAGTRRPRLSGTRRYLAPDVDIYRQARSMARSCGR